MRKPRSLIIAPFDAAGRRVNDAVRRALTELDINVSSIDDVESGGAWAETITDRIRSADFLVVDVTRQNPNVLYELGFAHAIRKPTILLASTEGKGSIPAALSGFHYIAYEPGNLRELVEYVQRAARPLMFEAAVKYE